MAEPRTQLPGELKDLAEVMWDTMTEMHRLGWRRDHPRILAWLERAGFRAFSELDGTAYQALLYNLRATATPENPAQAKQISHLQWQVEKLIEISYSLLVDRWNCSSPEGRKALLGAKQLLEKLRDRNEPILNEVPGVSSR
jgi:hypothetical protein